MQRPFRTFSSIVLISASLAIAACGSAPQGSRQPALYQQAGAPAQQQADPRNPADAQGYAAPTPAEMNRLIAKLDANEAEIAQLRQQLSDQYMDAIRKRREQVEAQQNGTTPAASQPTADATVDQAPASAAKPAGAIDLQNASRQVLVEELLNRIAQGQDPARTKALMVAAIAVASERNDLHHALLDELDPRSREQVARFHQMLAVVFDELAGDAKRELTRREMVEKIDVVFGAQPLKIEALELCRRVDSFGVYETFANTRFLAGRQNRVLIYVELENFHHEPTADGKFEVKLEQSVELYDATGEATVWRQGPVELIDVSRNKRRDFFIVFPIDLPARLTAGGYRLKVRVADKHTGSICEQTLHNIQIVADQALVAGE